MQICPRVIGHRQIHIGNGLGLHPLRRIDEQAVSTRAAAAVRTKYLIVVMTYRLMSY